MVTPERLLTVDEFWRQYRGQPYELMHGKVIKIKTGNYIHGSVSRRVTTKLGAYIDQHKLGDVLNGEMRFLLCENCLCSTDIAVISKKKLAQITEPYKYFPFAPDLAVEVISTEDRAIDVEQKTELFLQAGTSIVWLIYPALLKVIARYPNRTSEAFTGDQLLLGGFVLPDFSIPTSDLFPPQSAY